MYSYLKRNELYVVHTKLKIKTFTHELLFYERIIGPDTSKVELKCTKNFPI